MPEHPAVIPANAVMRSGKDRILTLEESCQIQAVGSSYSSVIY